MISKHQYGLNELPTSIIINFDIIPNKIVVLGHFILLNNIIEMTTFFRFNKKILPKLSHMKYVIAVTFRLMIRLS